MLIIRITEIKSKYNGSLKEEQNIPTSVRNGLHTNNTIQGMGIRRIIDTYFIFDGHYWSCNIGVLLAKVPMAYV